MLHSGTLGRTGIQVSPYALGAIAFGATGNPDHHESIGVIHKALEAEINLIDTGDAYFLGESEEIVGKALNVPSGRHGRVPKGPNGKGPLGPLLVQHTDHTAVPYAERLTGSGLWSRRASSNGSAGSD